MTKRMLIDASHAEETRVVVLDGNRLEDFDVETSTKRQLKGNIYLAKVVRVEPSLQAAFVEYGGGRHGFLAFDEIHPDYYQIPVADRQRLLAMQAEDAEREAAEDDRAAAEAASAEAHAEPITPPEEPDDADHDAPAHAGDDAHEPASAAAPFDAEPFDAAPEPDTQPSAMQTAVLVDVVYGTPDADTDTNPPAAPGADTPGADAPFDDHPDAEPATHDTAAPEATDDDAITDAAPDAPPPETVGGETDTVEEVRERRMPRFMRSYKIQEVIKRRQILLVQVVKEERGTKGAALTTYISLAGRFCVLMPNSPRGGGISRKITSAADRRRLKEITAELEIPRGMGLIVRTAGANRPKPEIRRDCEYLLRLWDDIRDHTMRSVAPALIYEEASLIKRAIRDVYSRDVDEILVDGEDGWKAARDFMRMLMPAHVKKVVAWRGDGQPLFAKHQVDAQLDAMLQPTVQLKSGGYLVINQTEALVAIDVNSGRSTRERGIEETALRTNTEAASEVARQLRLRDLAGLVVIDFIDMESKKHNAIVERRIKEALKDDRARIQVGHISHFGLLEMSRQRLRPSLAESSFIMCPHCAGTGQVRGTESAAIHVLRHIEEEGAKRRAAEIVVHVATPIAMYILNAKRDRLGEIEQRYGMRVTLAGDDTLIAPQVRIDRVRAQAAAEASSAITADAPPVAVAYATPDADEPVATDIDDDPPMDADDEIDAAPSAAATAGASPTGPAGEETAEEGERRRRRRRRRRGGHREDGPSAAVPATPAPASGFATDGDDMPQADAAAAAEDGTVRTAPGVPAGDAPAGDAPTDTETGEDGAQRPRRRGRRGGRRRRRDGDDALPAMAEPDADQPEIPQVSPYRGPTPADPFGGSGFDIYDVMEQVERAAEPAASQPEPEPASASASARIAPTPELVPEPMPESMAEPVPEPAPEPAGEADLAPSVVMVDTVLDIPPVPAAAPESQAAPLAAPAARPAPEAAPEPAPGPEREPEPAMGRPANDVAPAPLIQPVVIGETDTPAADKKRGWWRR
jgi:ribonuclease E